jgi:hypothetical protein
MKTKKKLKKISLTNIEGRLTIAEMENIMAGSGGAFCALVGFLFIPMGGMTPTNGWIWANGRACWYS